jgi:hypothetical protein
MTRLSPRMANATTAILHTLTQPDTLTSDQNRARYGWQPGTTTAVIHDMTTVMHPGHGNLIYLRNQDGCHDCRRWARQLTTSRH